MKKRISMILCAILIFICAAPMVCAADTTVTVTVSVADDMVIPETGLTVYVYGGHYRKKASSSSGEYDYSYPYEGRATSVFFDTSWWKQNRFSIEENYEVTFDSENRSQEVTFNYLDIYNDNYIMYEIATSGYIGSGGIVFTEEDSVSLEVSYIQGAELSGTVTLPQSAIEDSDYKIIALGNTENNPDIQQDYTFEQSSFIAFGETSGEYSMYVRPDMDYTLYIVFDDKQYTMQRKDTNIGADGASWDITAEQAKKISGTVKLPEGVTEFISSDGEELDEVQLQVVLQSADEPHYEIDYCSVNIGKGTDSAEFELYNISNSANTVIYYELLGFYWDMQGFYRGGAYCDNTKCVTNVKDAAVITSETENTDNIIINMIKASTVNINIENKSEYYYIGEVYAAVLDENGEVYVRVPADYISGDISGKEYSLSIPEGYSDYIIEVRTDEYYDEPRYYSENGFVKNISDADVFGITDGDKSVVFDGFEPNIPLTATAEGALNDEGTEYTVSVNIDSRSDFDEDDVAVYVCFYDENGLPVGLEREILEGGIYAHEEGGGIDIIYSAEDYNSAKGMCVFVWNENSHRPLCESVNMDGGLVTEE